MSPSNAILVSFSIKPETQDRQSSPSSQALLSLNLITVGQFDEPLAGNWQGASLTFYYIWLVLDNYCLWANQNLENLHFQILASAASSKLLEVGRHEHLLWNQHLDLSSSTDDATTLQNVNRGYRKKIFILQIYK